MSFFINNIKSTNDEILSFPITETLATDESLNQRLNFYKKALNLSFKKPLFGYGLGSGNMNHYHMKRARMKIYWSHTIHTTTSCKHFLS